MGKKLEGKCICGKDVYSNQLFVETEEGEILHLSCFNMLKIKSDDDSE